MNVPYKVIFSYKGTRYFGFQIQKEGVPTIQGEIHRALHLLSKGESFKTIGSGRTDAGVHAVGQVVKIELPFEIASEGLVRALNSFLPLDIRALSAERLNENFHPIFSAVSKEYHYIFSAGLAPSPLLSDMVTPLPFKLDIALMQKGCKLFCGEFDFVEYQCVGTEVEHSVRTIYSCELVRIENSNNLGPFSFDGHYVLKIVGNGFLKQMVRLIMGALINLGRGKIELSDIEKSLKHPQKSPVGQRLGATAPPQGLYLIRVNY